MWIINIKTYKRSFTLQPLYNFDDMLILLYYKQNIPLSGSYPIRLQQVEDKLYHNVILKSQYFIDPLSDPWLDRI